MALKLARERRIFARVDMQRKVELKISTLSERLRAYSLNFSEAGVCVRTEASLDVKTSVRLRMFMGLRGKPLECSGKVAWVVQRLDLRSAPPFLYDIGVELINPPSSLREFVSGLGPVSRPMQSLVYSRKVRQNRIQPASVHGRIYEPHVEKDALSGHWHLVVTVEGTPCFSRHAISMREALKSWQDFKRSLFSASSKSIKSIKST